MKKLLILSSVMLAVGYGACKKPSGPANGNSVQPNNNLDSLVFMTAAINGTDWKADSVFGYRVKNSGNDSGKVNLMITAISKGNGDPSTIVFNIYNYTGPQKYIINPPYVTATYYKGTTRFYATYGDVNITSNANYSLIGDFYFSADIYNVNGSFNVAMP